MKPIEAYKLFQSIKWYYEKESYDYFKYRGKVAIKQETFDTKRDKYFYYKLSKIPNLEFYLACNLFLDSKLWVGNILEEKYRTHARVREGVVKAIDVKFRDDISRYDSYNDMLIVRSGNYPKIVQDYLDMKVNPETIAIVDVICNEAIFPYWSKKCNDIYVWPDTQARIQKYGRFLSIDKERMKEIADDVLN